MSACEVAPSQPDDVEDSLYRRLLGPAFDDLPQAVRALHGSSKPRRWIGSPEVRRGNGFAARLLGILFGFPETAEHLPLAVTFTPENGDELWTRDFGGKIVESFQSAGTGRDRQLVVERFGPARFALAFVAEKDRLFLVPRRWFLGPIPMPNWLLPGGTTFETDVDGRFGFHITVDAPLIGLIVAYRGVLEPAPENPP